MGVPRPRISIWENERSVPETEHLPGIARALGRTVGWVLGTEDETGENGTTARLAVIQRLASGDIPDETVQALATSTAEAERRTGPPDRRQAAREFVKNRRKGKEDRRKHG